MSLDYLQLISGDDLKKFFQDQVRDAFSHSGSAPPAAAGKQKPRFTTVNLAYAERLTQLARELERYLTDGSLTRPFLYLILGPPGAGKSFLIERLIDYLSENESNKAQPIVFQQANLSELAEPRELHPLFQNITSNTEKKRTTITLLDEFDIKWSSGSAIKYLINPIYDGKFWHDNQFQKFGKCAFFFAGSYLQDRETLLKTQKLLSGVNLNAFLFDLYFELRKQNDVEGLKEVREIQELCYLHEKWRGEVDPRTDTIFYLSSLEKIKDFLSRVAGNIFEILDVSWPLHVTVEEFVIEQGCDVEPSARIKLSEVMTYVMHRLNQEENRGDEKIIVSYQPQHNPLLEYKNMILCERLLRVIDFLKKRFGQSFEHEDIKKQSGVYIDRKLLNFLTVVPLINGMRSLEQLVSKLDKPAGGTIKPHKFKPADISMIVYESEKFGDADYVWAELLKNNPGMNKVANEQILIPLP
jgi:hypothetical protein